MGELLTEFGAAVVQEAHEGGVDWCLMRIIVRPERQGGVAVSVDARGYVGGT